MSNGRAMQIAARLRRAPPPAVPSRRPGVAFVSPDATLDGGEPESHNRPMNEQTRRRFLYASTAAGATFILDACRNHTADITAEPPSKMPLSGKSATDSDKPDKPDKPAEAEVTATEDLMREHGVLRRALIVYREAAARLRAKETSVSPAALQETAKLFRSFGEDYHERKLEEAVIFPGVRKAGGPAASLPDVLMSQHQRGRDITDYVLAVTAAPRVGVRAVELATVLDAFVRMYESHTAREDTVLFPAWKQTLSAKELDEIGDRFEDIEHDQFGKDGYEAAVRQITAIEGELGLGDLAAFTAPAPPKA